LFILNCMWQFQSDEDLDQPVSNIRLQTAAAVHTSTREGQWFMSHWFSTMNNRSNVISLSLLKL
jgi:hypothetical protein